MAGARNVQPTVREFALPREPFARLIDANRLDQRVTEYERWADVKHYCVHSADPCGRRARRVASARRRRARRGERLGVHRAAAREVSSGRSARSSARSRLSAGGGPPPLRRACTRSSERGACRAAPLRGRTCGGAAARRRRAAFADRRALGRAVGLFARGGLAALDALEAAGWDLFTRRPKPSRARLAREAALVVIR